MRKIFILALCASFCTSFVATQAHAICGGGDVCAQVSELDDFNFGSYTFTGDITANSDFCPYLQNDNETDYQMTVDGDGAGGAFIITTGGSDLSLTVDYYNVDTLSYQSVSNGVSFVGNNANNVIADCSSGSGYGRVRITIPESVLENATAGNYTGNVTFSMNPD